MLMFSCMYDYNYSFKDLKFQPSYIDMRWGSFHVKTSMMLIKYFISENGKYKIRVESNLLKKRERQIGKHLSSSLGSSIANYIFEANYFNGN